MGGGLMQLVAYGAQDIYLTGNPQITFFKVVYRRHTNFSMETIQQTINGTSTATSGGSGTVTISRNGDLVHKIYVTSSTASIENGDELVSEVELEIGGQRIDRHYKEWNQIWNELTTTESKAAGLLAMQGCVGTSGGDGVGMVQVPLNFWFCRNPGLALPLIALQYHEVKLKFTWGTNALTGATAAACQVWCDYIYLDTDERRRFAQVSHEYLIEQLQKQSASNSTSQKLNFNHPVKELIWTSAGAYTDAKLKLNGHDRFAAQEEEYFQLRQPFDHHTAIPRNNLPLASHQSQAITRHPLTHTDGVGLGTAVCTQSSLTWVKVAGSTVPLSAAPAAGAALTNATTAASCFVVGGLDAASGIFANSLKVGDVHSIVVHDQSGATKITTTATVARIVLSTLSAVAQLVKVSNGLGPVDHELGTIAVDDNLLTANANANTMTNGTGGSLLVCYDTLITFAAALASAKDSTEILNLSTHRPPLQARTSSMANKSINVYSFALKPEEHQPSGTCNFSRIDTAKLDTTLALVAADNIYAVNYNVLRIMSGMGGLAYSN
jgi:hypothetical protein